MDNIFKFFFRTSFICILIGIGLTLAFQFFFLTPSKKTVANGPAERVGEAVDRGIAGLGKLTERAGQEMQKATVGTDKSDRGDVPAVNDKAEHITSYERRESTPAEAKASGDRSF